MVLQSRPAYSSRVTKPRVNKQTFFGRSSTSRATMAQSIKAKLAERDEDDDLYDDHLDDIGTVDTLGKDLSLRDVAQAMQYIRSHMFDDIPDHRSGMNSARITEVLNFRKALPTIITNAHVHALINSPTAVEKEIAQLVSAELLRRVTIPGRGIGAGSVSDCIVLVKDWVTIVQASSSLSSELKDKYILFLGSKKQSFSSIQHNYDEVEISSLMRAGFLTSVSTAMKSQSSISATSSFRVADRDTLTSLESVSRAASGSLAAIGGTGSVLNTGGGGSGGLGDPKSSIRRIGEMKASLPNTGSFLKLIEGARSHLVYLLAKSKYSEGPVYLLRERWDGGISTKNPYGRSKDPFLQILPGKTRKWKEYYGLKFDWVLAECLGAGLVEVFETGSVGLGVRVV